MLCLEYSDTRVGSSGRIKLHRLVNVLTFSPANEKESHIYLKIVTANFLLIF